eukprot:674820-Pelagomonas_calceolata.AAC.4
MQQSNPQLWHGVSVTVRKAMAQFYCCCTHLHAICWKHGWECALALIRVLKISWKPTGEKEYVTPKSESLVDTGAMGEVMNVNIPAAMKHLADVEQEVRRQEGCRLSGRGVCTHVLSSIAHEGVDMRLQDPTIALE